MTEVFYKHGVAPLYKHARSRVSGRFFFRGKGSTERFDALAQAWHGFRSSCRMSRSHIDVKCAIKRSERAERHYGVM